MFDIIKALFLQRTALDDEGLLQAAQIRKLEKISIAACKQITFEGLMAIAWRDKLCVIDKDEHDEEGRAGLFTQEQWKAYEDARTYKNMKNQLPLDSLELKEPIAALQAFFDAITQWERAAEQNGQGDQSVIDALFDKRVSWKPRPGWRPVHLSWKSGGTYPNHRLIAGERVTKNKVWLYAENDIFYYRYLMRRMEDKWMIDNAQWCQNECWEFCGL